MMKLRNSKKGQTMVEYIIIVVIIAIAVIAVAGVFSDRIRALFGGATVELGGDGEAVQEATDTKSEEYLKTVGDDISTGD